MAIIINTIGIQGMLMLMIFSSVISQIIPIANKITPSVGNFFPFAIFQSFGLSNLSKRLFAILPPFILF